MNKSLCWAALTLLLLVGCKRNHPPQIESAKQLSESISPGDSVELVVIATDPDHDKLKYKWHAKDGALTSISDSFTRWVAPDKLGGYKVDITVTDKAGAKATKTLDLKVMKSSPVFSGSLGGEVAPTKRSRAKPPRRGGLDAGAPGKRRSKSGTKTK
jgi:hypothetical protein